MSSDNSKQSLRKIITWLNEQHPHLALVMYDIGARLGIHYLYTELLELQNFSVIGFEPDREEVTKLNNSEYSGIKKTFPFAIAESQASRTIFITKYPGCSSLYPPNKDLLSQYLVSDFFEVVKTETIETISLDEFTKQFDVVQPDFLKIDTQGAEYEILKGGQSTLNKVIGVFLETQLRELYIGAALFPDIHSLLTNLGFRLIFCEYNPDLGGEVVEFDVAYVRDSTDLELEDDLVKAVLFCLVHNNLNFAANLVRRSRVSEQKKSQIMEFLSQPLHPAKIMVDPNDPYVNSRVELRKINEGWWRTKPD